MICSRCQKRLSRKTARQIDGVVMCSACMFAGSDPVRLLVQEAIGRIEPLRGDGPNFWTVEVPGWAISAPTKEQLHRMLWDWFKSERDSGRLPKGDDHD